MFAAVTAGCTSGGGDGDDNGGGNSRADMGVNNKTDYAVTGGVQDVGMTYARVRGYLNLELSTSVVWDLHYYGFLGVNYGLSETMLDQAADEVSILDNRTIDITIKDLKPNTKYYYRFRYYIEGEGSMGEQIGTFTTNEASFNGLMTVDNPENVTFKGATISGSVNTSSLNDNETFWKGLAYSVNSSDLSGDLASKLKGANYVPGPDALIPIGYVNTTYSGHYVNGNLHFQISSSDLTAEVEMERGSTIYYCPVIIIGDKSFVGDMMQVTARDLVQTSGFVDLGLSCLWSVANVGATSPWEMGKYYESNTYYKPMTTQYDSEARLPTQDEVEELNRCSFESMNNGVLITGPNGNQIFLMCSDPDVARLYDNYKFYTSSYQSTNYSSRRVYFQYSSYDGAFITYTNSLDFGYVRPVKDK